jgi:hypothetical protein
MAHFQLPDGTRFWDRDHKHEKIAIHLGNEIELEQFSETSASGKIAQDATGQGRRGRAAPHQPARQR